MSVSNPSINSWICRFFVFFMLTGCQKKTEETASNTLFQLLPPESSGVHFINRITPDETTNILTYEYMYNGGGVGVGDFNNDGFEDVFLAGSQTEGKLYINKGKGSATSGFSFVDMTENSGITRDDDNWAFGVSVVDINQDGLQDIYISMGGPGSPNRFPNN